MKKRILSLLIAGAMMFTTMPTILSATEKFPRPGDVDGNGAVDIMDILEIMKYLSGISSVFDDGPGSPAWDAALAIVPNANGDENKLLLEVLAKIWGRMAGYSLTDCFSDNCSCEYCENCKNLIFEDLLYYSWSVGNITDVRTVFCRCQPYNKPGHVLGNQDIGIMDALEILKYLAGIPSVLDGSIRQRANMTAVIIKSEDPDVPDEGKIRPDIMDALEILKHLAGIPSVLD